MADSSSDSEYDDYDDYDDADSNSTIILEVCPVYNRSKTSTSGHTSQPADDTATTVTSGSSSRPLTRSRKRQMASESGNALGTTTYVPIATPIKLVKSPRNPTSPVEYKLNNFWIVLLKKKTKPE